MVLFIAAASTLSEETVFTCLSRFHGSDVFFVDRKAANDMKRLLLIFSRHFFSSPLKEPLPIIKIKQSHENMEPKNRTTR